MSLPSLNRSAFLLRIERAFTLIELLVVIGIVALLIGFLLPALNKARVQSKSVTCMSRLRQIGIAFQSYAAANKGTIKLHSWESWTDPQTQAQQSKEIYWFGTVNPSGMTMDESFLQPYMSAAKGEAIYDCPAAEDAGMQNIAGVVYRGTSQGVAYGTPWLLISDKPVRLTHVRNSSETFLLADAAIVDPSALSLIRSFLILWPRGQVSSSVGFPLMESSPPGQVNPPTVHARHGDRANVLWFDGHVTGETLTYTGSFVAPLETYKSRKVGHLMRGDIQSIDASYYFFFDKSRRSMF